MWIVLTVMAFGSVGRLVAIAEERKPGDVLVIPIRLKEGGTLPLKFRYCPAGKFVPGDPVTNQPQTAKSVDVGPFFLSETEITQQQFFQILGNADPLSNLPAGRSQPAEYLQPIAEDVNAEMKPGTFVGDAYPIYYLNVHEAARFCVSIERPAQDSAPLVAAYRFRIPTNHEWQFACRATMPGGGTDMKTPPLPHFNRWPPLEALKPATKGQLEEAWAKLQKKKKVESLEPFTCSQDQVFEILEANDGSQEFLGLLSAFSKVLEAALGSWRDMGINDRGVPFKAGGTHPNEWGFVDMHGNVAEWTLQTRQDWDALFDPAKRAGSRFVAAGGHFNLKPDSGAKGTKGLWKRFTIWGGQAMDYATAADPGQKLRYNAGVRVLMEIVPSADYVVRLRQTLTESLRGKESPKENIARIDAIGEQMTGFDAGAGKEMREKLNYYKALLHYVDQDLNASADAVTVASREVRRSAEADAAFLDTIGFLISRDKESK